MKKYFKLLIGILIFFPGLSLWGADAGLILDQTADYSGSANDGIFRKNNTPERDDASKKDNVLEYSSALIPWFSVYSGDNGGGFYFSASIRADWKDEKDKEDEEGKKKKALSFMPELLRTEFSWRSESGEFKLGRMQYTDPLGFIADGLFDGAFMSMDMGGGSVNMGTWYTGLLCKERANITMTPAEMESYNVILDYDNFMDTYFAPRRIVSTLGWEHPGLAEQVRVKLAVLGQFDLAKENSLNTQYFMGKFSAPVNDFVFDLGGCLETIEYADEYKMALAGEVGFSWLFTATRLSLTGRYSGGMPEKEDSKMTAFLPLSTVYQGNVLKARLSGISVVTLDYLCRLHRTFSANLAASCFLRSDLGAYSGYPVTAASDDDFDKKTYILGTELFGRFCWAPVSDIQINLGGGAFLPAMGNVARNAPLLWRAEINLTLALY